MLERLAPRWAVVSAALAPVILLATAGLARVVRTRSYDPMTQSLSTLAAHGRGGWIMTVGFAISATCEIVTAIGLRILRPIARVALAPAGCAGLAVAALPDRLGTATPHIAAVGVAATLMAIWPMLTVSLEHEAARSRHVRWAVSVSVVIVLLVAWLYFDFVRGVRLGLSERMTVCAEQLWPLVVVLSVRHRLRRRMAGDPQARDPHRRFHVRIR